MKKTGTCPKCSSLKVYKKALITERRAMIKVSILTYFTVDVYVCLDCGYLEEYMTEKDLANDEVKGKIREKWDKNI